MRPQTYAYILVDHARGHQAAKRGGSVIKLPLDEGVHGSPKHEEMDLVALDEALTRLANMDPEQSRLVELRYFGGLTIEETARVMGHLPGYGQAGLDHIRGLVAPRDQSAGRMTATQRSLVVPRSSDCCRTRKHNSELSRRAVCKRIQFLLHRDR